MTKTFWSIPLFALLLTIQSANAQAPPEKVEAKASEKYSSGWMKLKLEYSQKLLAGIAKGDFDSIVQNAEGMRGLTMIEEFVRGRKPGYALQLDIFKDANSEMIKQAQQGNLEGTALAFTQLTLSCVNCHKRIREEPKAKAK
jgi:hypothetical protein